MSKGRATQTEPLHVSSAFAHDCTCTIALVNVKAEPKSSEQQLAARRTTNVTRLGLDFSTCTVAIPERDWVQHFLHDIKIKLIVASSEKSHARGNVPAFSRALSFTIALSQLAATLSSAPLGRQRQAPRPAPRSPPLPRRSPWHTGSLQARTAPAAAPQPAASPPSRPRGGSSAHSPWRSDPGRPRVPRPRSPTLCRNSRATRRSMVRGCCAGAGGAGSGCAGEAAPRSGGRREARPPPTAPAAPGRRRCPTSPRKR